MASTIRIPDGVTVGRTIGAVSFSVLLTTSALARADEGCTAKEAIAADAEAGTLRSWPAIHASYLKYAKCDDGSIAEGYGESISLVLEERWVDLTELQALVERDKSFESFVLKHLNESVPAKRLAAIQAHARERCVPNLSRLCGWIAATIQRIQDLYKPKP